MDAFAHQAGGTHSSQVGELVLNVLQTVTTSVLALVPSHQAAESIVGLFVVTLHIIAGSFQGEEHFIARQDNAVRGPALLPRELVQHTAVLL